MRWQQYKSVVAVALIWSSPLAAKDKRFDPPGVLEQPITLGEGVKDETILYPNMLFPLKDAPAYLNSQVYNPGGMHGRGGGQDAASNYNYPWSDNFCEKRSWSVPLCPGGHGHQGQDIRPSKAIKKEYVAVAVADGVIAHIGEYSVSLQTAEGTVFRYLHLDKPTLRVTPLEKVKKGAEIGLVSDNFGNSQTTIHLHFDIKDSILVSGKKMVVFVPPYTSLMNSYKKMIK